MEHSVVVTAHHGIAVAVIENTSGETWHVTKMLTAIEDVPQDRRAWLDVYHEYVHINRHIDKTTTAAQDSSEVDFALCVGNKLIGVYTGIQESAQCKFSLITNDAA